MLQSLDTEMLEYWALLQQDQKKSIVAFLKSFVKKEDSDKVDIVQYNKILDETLQAMEDGSFYTQEEANAILNKTLNDKKH